MVPQTLTVTQISGAFMGVVAKDGAGQTFNVRKGKF